jgi:long-chain acyl-CoA synthetase
MKNVFLTGATGLLGSNILKMLLLKTNADISTLVRGNNQKDAENRILSILKNLFKVNYVDRNYLGRIRVFCGSMETQNLDIFLKENIASIEEFYHCAATLGFRISESFARMVNVQGTLNMLNLAMKYKEMKRFHYVSTTFIAGNKEGEFSEGDIEVGQQFNNNYEKSKMEAEQLVRSYSNSQFNILIYRPSIVMGDYFTGETTNFKMFYEPLHMFSREIFDAVPANPNALHNLVPVDAAVQAIYLLASHERSNSTFHITSPENTSSGHFMDLAASFFKYKNPRFVPIDDFDLKRLSTVQLKLIEPFIPYFNYKTVYNSDKTQQLLDKYDFRYPKIDDAFYLRMFQFCHKVGFIRISK